MKTIAIFFVACFMMTSCLFNKSTPDQTEKSEAEQTQAMESKAQVPLQRYKLTYPGSNISFEVSVQGKRLTIKSSGLSVSSDPIIHDITGYTVTGAEIGDLNIDGYPEVFVYLTSDGSGSYGKLIGYSVNAGKSIIEVYLPSIANNPELSKGYMGHDEMAIVESTFCQRFPIYSNGIPSGKMRQIQYKMVDARAGRTLEVDQVLVF